MKFIKVRQLLLATFAVCGLALGGCAVAQANEAPNAVTIKLHKLDNRSDETETQHEDSNRVIENTGEELTKFSDGVSVTPYDAQKLEAVTFGIYDLTAFLADKQVVSGQTSAEEFEKVRDDVIAEIVGDKTDPAEVLRAQKDFVKKHKLQPIQTKKLTDSSGILTFTGLANKGFYLIMETEAPTHHLTGLSAPMIIGLPLSNRATIHLYPKNLVARDVDPEIHKVGRNPERPTSGKYLGLEGVKFTLQRADGKGESRDLVTDKDGNIAFGSLEVGTEYVLTEADNSRYPYYDQVSAKDHKTALTFTVDKEGNVKAKEMLPDAKHFVIRGSKISILNDLTLGGAKFKKVDSKTEKGLVGAKFKVQKVDSDGNIFWAVFNRGTFVKWVDKKANGTTLTSDQHGRFQFNGVPYVYDGKVTYNLIETQAPAGYALLKEATEFEIDGRVHLETIKNHSYALPVTGGMGIWLFLLIGGLLMGGAGYLYYRQRRSS
ncbi:SpaA isopeptide-forming pilin-related protein [Levilactobacillus sp. HBUAS70063]|uniref:SpaA isopeptide-forming pilin-related protein n=1 Tax=Levilactobacillus sp. HBUAS70063 TaxID=3109359 RepID=UPI003132D09B